MLVYKFKSLIYIHCRCTKILHRH